MGTTLGKIAMMKREPFAVVIPAAGSGKRFGGGDKLMMDLGGQSVLQRAVGIFAGRSDVGQIVIVTAADRFELYGVHLRSVLGERRATFIAGGRERWESVMFGVKAVEAGIDYVAVHDAARPLTSNDVVEAAFRGAIEVGGSVPCVAEPATLKRMGEGGKVAETVERAGLYQAQTPQCFRKAELLAAYEKLLGENRIADVTDDAQVFERVGRAVVITAGASSNIKITTAEDVALAKAILVGKVFDSAQTKS
jgi:2-C-methyl-D-erythritol 4-phosphate cytidylyltransferase